MHVKIQIRRFLTRVLHLVGWVLFSDGLSDFRLGPVLKSAKYFKNLWFVFNWASGNHVFSSGP